MAVKLERSGGDGLDTGYDEVRIGRAAYTVLADLVAIGKEGGAATAERFAQLAGRPRNVTVEVVPAGTRIVPPTGFQQSVSGNLVMFILLVMFTSGSVTLTLERDRGILRRLASSPMSRPAVVAGMLLGNFARSDGQAVGIGVLASNVLAALGGCWWPIEVTPGWAQKVALALPTGWAMDALHKLISFGAPPVSVLPHLAALGAATLLAAWLLARRFRFQ